MPNFSSRPVGAGVPYYSTTDPTVNTSPLLPLGTPVEVRDGRMFRWCMVGASDLVAGNTIQSSAFLTNHTAMAIATPTAALGGRLGDTFVNVTPGATAGAANLYAEGFMTVSVTPGLGYTYKVDHHPAITSSTAFNVYLDPADPIQIALTSSSKVDLIAHPYQNVIQFPITTATGTLVGVAGYIIKATQNGWLQTQGPCAVLNKGTTGAGLLVGAPGSVAGGVVVFAAATTTLAGHIMQTGVDASCNLVHLRIG
jgi:hypothetical protein